ncbi:hypothetical protein NS330_06065 [Curtobacterium citreum]|nr:hypothetical protein NS330_06065 [Curtobacterium citreum]
MRRAPSGPRRAERRVDDVVGHDQGQPGLRLGEGHRPAEGRRGPDDGHALAEEHLRDGVGERTGAVHLDPGEGLREHVDDRW